VTVAGVAGLEARRHALSRGRAERLLAVPPVLWRRSAGAGEQVRGPRAQNFFGEIC
jgi:hypothetical protein